MAPDGRCREFFADLLRNAIFQFGVPFKKTDKLMIGRRHAGIDFESESIPVLDPTLEPFARQSSSPKIAEKRRRFDLVVIGVENDFSNRFGFLFCFLRGHFDMFGHRFVPSRQVIADDARR